MTASSRLHLPRIYPITDRTSSGLTHTEQVRELIAGGATFIQLREKALEAGEWLDDARSAVSLARQASVRIIINDRADLAIVLKADGVHLGQDDLPPDAARRLLDDGAIIGYSTHTIEQAASAALMPVDYVAFGPIFPTNTKSGNDVVGLKMLEDVRRNVGDIPLVAIGGIGENELCSVFRAGADSAAVISSVLSEPKAIRVRMRSLLDLEC